MHSCKATCNITLSYSNSSKRDHKEYTFQLQDLQLRLYTLPCSPIFGEDVSWNVMAHTQKPDFVFRRNGRVHLNRRGLQFSRLLATEVCASTVVMLATPRSEVVWRVLATHSIRQFPLHFPSHTSPCAITFQLESTCNDGAVRQYNL